MKRFLELFAHRRMVIFALIFWVAPFAVYDLDPRIGILLTGLIFGLSGVGNFLAAEKESTARGLRKALGVFLILFGLFTVAVMIIMFIRGEHLSTPV